MMLEQYVRPSVLKLKPYSSARDEYKGKNASVFLDANENPFNKPVNRYPDPLQWELKTLIASIKKVSPEQLFLGNGSDEAIDLLIRVFCEPAVHNIVSINPTYGMYKVCADINNIKVKEVSLKQDYSLDADAVISAVDEASRLVFLCSPNNPSGNFLDLTGIEKILKTLSIPVIVDEAYIDFTNKGTSVDFLSQYPNCIVLQTFSKAWGLAGIRLGLAIAMEEVIGWMNKIKYPYNVNVLTQRAALKALANKERKDQWVSEILQQRDWLMKELAQVPLIKKIFPSDANFFLVSVEKPRDVYNYLIDKGIVVRDRSSVHLCENNLRITVGKKAENIALVKALKMKSEK